MLEKNGHSRDVVGELYFSVARWILLVLCGGSFKDWDNC
jgi:hypothetical protein